MLLKKRRVKSNKVKYLIRNNGKKKKYIYFKRKIYGNLNIYIFNYL